MFPPSFPLVFFFSPPVCRSCFPGSGVAASRALCTYTQYGANLKVDAKGPERRSCPAFMPPPARRAHFPPLFSTVQIACWSAGSLRAGCFCRCFHRNWGEKKKAHRHCGSSVWKPAKVLPGSATLSNPAVFFSLPYFGHFLGQGVQ